MDTSRQIHFYTLVLEEYIIDSIKTTLQNFSGGPNEFPAILLKQCSKSLVHPRQLRYQASLKTGEIQVYLKPSIYKGGSSNLPKNYYPVALTLHLIEILEKLFVKKYSPTPRNAPENESQATWLTVWQILPLPATGVSQQDIGGIGKVNQYFRHITEQTQKKIGINGAVGVWITIFYQTDNNVLLSMEQHQSKLKT